MLSSTIIRVTGIVATVAAGLVVGGCTSDNHGGHGRHPHIAGMACPRCETVWVHDTRSSAGGRNIHAMRWGREMVCPDCDAMAEAYFEDGEKVLHDCPTCKVTPRPASTRPLTPTHPKGTHS